MERQSYNLPVESSEIEQHIEYSRWLLRPLDKELQASYTTYLRSQVRATSLKSGIVLLIIGLLSCVLSIKNKGFKVLSKELESNVFYSFALFGYSACILFLTALYKKTTASMEFIGPLYVICYYALCFPTFMHSPKDKL